MTRILRSLRLTASIVASLVALMAAAPAFAGPVSLRSNPMDDDGRITLGDLFEDAGAAANVMVARRNGASAVLEAGQVQAIARQNGLQWSNPQGLRRIAVRDGGAAPAEASSRPASASVAARNGATVEVLTYVRSLSAGDVVQPEDVAWTPVQAHMAVGGAPQDAEQVIGLSARRALRAGSAVAVRDLSAPQVIARNDMVQVAFIADGVRLTLTGRASRNAAAGEAVPIVNLQSGRTIDAVAIAPGQAVTGPGAASARANPQQFASR